jgi:hypothetical protein
MKLDLLTNATVVDDAIRIVSQKAIENKSPSNSSHEDEYESNEPDYNETRDQLEEARDITPNHVF